MPDIPRPKAVLPERPPEKNIETGFETREKPEPFSPEKIKERVSDSIPQPAPAVVPFVLTEPVVLQKKVEKILEEGLEQLYAELNPQEQAQFRSLGEITAQKITSILKQAKVKIEEILSLIHQWLMSIGGVNRYFVEQEAKIKAGKIFRLKEDK